MRKCGWCQKECPADQINQRIPAAGAFICHGCCGTTKYQSLKDEFYKTHDIMGQPLNQGPPRPTVSEELRRLRKQKNLCENCGSLVAVLMNVAKMCSGIQPEQLGFAKVEIAEKDIREQLREHVAQTSLECEAAGEEILKRHEPEFKRLVEAVIRQYGVAEMRHIIQNANL